jgi:hypothetical protein
MPFLDDTIQVFVAFLLALFYQFLPHVRSGWPGMASLKRSSEETREGFGEQPENPASLPWERLTER